MGYSPVCKNEWDPVLCKRPRIKCAKCPGRDFLPLNEKALFEHLSGKRMIGIYPMLKDETCLFLAIDFDKEDWQKNAAAFLETCEKFHIPAALERSQ